LLPLIAAIAVVLVAPVVALWVFGSRTPVDTAIRFEPAAIGSDPEAYLRRSEAAIADIRPGLAKEIVWFDPQRQTRTKVAIVYVHGFSASPAETRPLPDIVARNLGANLFLTRLTGHGASREAMGTFTVNDLVHDFAEAIAIGERLGESVVVLACSSGAALATWSLGRPEFANRIAAAVRC
jgi:pimeloyl-ACP methyl ester carboxylesterase